jgi:cytochrome c
MPRRLLNLVLAALILLPVPGMAQDLAAGETVFKKCAACHAVGEGAKNRVGPVLNGVVGRPAGTIEGFKYSPAMLESGLVWDEATLATYLKSPKDLVPKTKMAFAGLKEDADIANLVAYLKQFAADGTKVAAQ